MLNFIKFFLYLAFGLATIAACSPFPDTINIGDTGSVEARKDNWDSFIFQNNGKALVETWVGRSARNVGDVTGEGLYQAAKDYMDSTCVSNKFGSCNHLLGPEKEVQTHAIVNGKFPNIRPATFKMKVYAKWANDDVRKQLIEQMARTMRKILLSEEPLDVMPNSITNATIQKRSPAPLKIATPCLTMLYSAILETGSTSDYQDLDKKQNYIRMKIGGSNDDVYSGFRCCRSLNKVDEVVDAAKDSIRGLGFYQDITRDAKCLIAYQVTCGECGPACDGCGATCPHVWNAWR